MSRHSSGLNMMNVTSSQGHQRASRSMSSLPYLHRGISKLNAETLLLNAGKDGSFLVRDSETLHGAFVLCLLHQNQVLQYRIIPDENGLLSVQGKDGNIMDKFSDLKKLIGFYEESDKNGLKCRLSQPIASEKQEDPDSDDDDEDSCSSGKRSPMTPGNRFTKNSLLQSFCQVDLSCCEGEFVTATKNYVEKGVELDSAAVKSGDADITEFHNLLWFAGRGLQKELDDFMYKMALFKTLFHNTVSTEKLTTPKLPNSKPEDLTPTALIEKLSQCKTQLSALENQAAEFSRQLVVDTNQFQFSPPPVPHTEPPVPQISFEVKRHKYGNLAAKTTLTVDLKAGSLYVLKGSKESLNSRNLLRHDQILQVVKNSTDNCRLDLVVVARKPLSFQFLDVQTREKFCQEIMQMKRIHCKEEEVDSIRIFIGTWNMGDSIPTTGLNSWLKCEGSGKRETEYMLSQCPHDLYVIGTQESAMTEKDWVNSLKATIRDDMAVDLETIEVCSLWGIRLVILGLPDHKNRISHIQHSTVKTGIANKLGNKGAVAISFHFRGTSFCFINSHLTSGDERCARRNQNYRDIVKGLQLGQKHQGIYDVTNQFQNVFWFGDLNYRLGRSVKTVLEMINSNELSPLLKVDQLKKVQNKKEAFYGFDEAEVKFLPTYRLSRGDPHNRTYDWRKIKATGERINTPSWCDRVLWKSYPRTFIRNLAYGCTDNIVSSDHNAVFSSFTVGIASQFVTSKNSLMDENLSKIIFDNMEATVRTCCKLHFQLEFNSSCLQGVRVSRRNEMFNNHKTGLSCCPFWPSTYMPEMQTLFGDKEYLEEQHILIAVRTGDSDNESYGECVVPLKGFFKSKPQPFEHPLMHRGEYTGTLSGLMHVRSNTNKEMTRKASKSYDFVLLDTDYHDPELFLSDQPPSPQFYDPMQTQPVYEDINHAALSSSLSVESGLMRPSSYTGQDLVDQEVADRQSFSDSETGPRLRRDAGRADTHAPPARRPKPLMGQSSLAASQRQVLPIVSPTVHSKLNDLAGFGKNQDTTQTESLHLHIPPPIPQKAKQHHYTKLQYPESIASWLLGLKLSQYVATFVNSGWDDTTFVVDISEEDLFRMNITQKDHRERILSSIHELKQLPT